MSGIIEGYNYDIFISYRQKDNKGDRWVSEFVDALKDELESTFKEEVKVFLKLILVFRLRGREKESRFRASGLGNKLSLNLYSKSVHVWLKSHIAD